MVIAYIRGKTQLDKLYQHVQTVGPLHNYGEEDLRENNNDYSH